MWRALLIAALVGLVAAAASADIRRLMQAKGYSPIQAGGESCSSGCNTARTETNPVAPPPDTGCTLTAVLPCTL